MDNPRVNADVFTMTEGGEGRRARKVACVVTWCALIGGGRGCDNKLPLSHWLLGPASSARVIYVEREEVWAQLSQRMIRLKVPCRTVEFRPC